MKILYFSPHPDLHLHSASGYGTHMREMIKAFKSVGHEVEPIIMGGSEPSVIPGAPASPGPMKRLAKGLIPQVAWESMKDARLKQFDAGLAKKSLDQAIKRFKPDVIYERANYLQISGVEAAKQWGVPHLMEVNSPYVEESIVLKGKSWFIPAAIKAEAQQLTDTSKVLVVSTKLRDYFIERTGLSQDHFSIIPNAIDPDKLKIDTSLADSIIDQYQLAGKTVFGFVGSIFPWHGVDLLINAFKEVHQYRPDTALLIVGDGEVLEDLKGMTQSMSLSHAIHFTGMVAHQEVFTYLSCMDVCVLANSHWYGSPIKLFEYGAMGKAIIAPNNGPVNEVATHHEDAMLVDPEVEPIISAMKFCLDQPEQRHIMAKRFQNKVLSHHTWEQNVERVLTAIF